MTSASGCTCKPSSGLLGRGLQPLWEGRCQRIICPCNQPSCLPSPIFFLQQPTLQARGCCTDHSVELLCHGKRRQGRACVAWLHGGSACSPEPRSTGLMHPHCVLSCP